MAVFRSIPRWAGQAVSKSVAGMVLGLLTACVLAWLSHGPFPGLQAYSEDLGLRLAVFVDRVSASVSGAAPRKGNADRYSFVFLDVDPEEGGGATTEMAVPRSACDAYSQALRAGGVETEAGAPWPELSCSSARPLNRHLLAALVAGLRQRGARLIVLDVLLAEEPGVVDEGENEALRRVLGDDAGSGAPIVFAAPYELATPQGDHAGETRVALALEPLIAQDHGRRLYASVALPAPGQPVRRYPKCLRQQDVAAPSVPSLPFLAAELLRAGNQGADACNGSDRPPVDAADAPTNVPRIVYTLPPMTSHQDAGPATARAGWAQFRDVHNRCLAKHFWNATGSHCGQGQAYLGKVVVIGASNPLRRDRHYTPLGDMAGPEVVINAVRSFLAYPQLRDRRLPEVLRQELALVPMGGLVWLFYFMFRCRLVDRAHAAPSSVLGAIGRSALILAAFVVALVVAVAVALFWSYETAGPVPSLDVLVPVLAIAVDEYVELASKIVHRVESWVDAVLGLRSESDT
jgi:hypothetical protein